ADGVRKWSAGPGQAPAELADKIAFAGPVPTQHATEAIVPLRPPRGKAADPIALGTEIPRFGNQLDSGQNRILSHSGEESHAAVKAVDPAGERCCEIEPEAVDVTDLHPVP